MSEPRIIVALDMADVHDALQFVGRVDPSRCRLKVGKALFTRAGPAVVEQLIGKGFSVFLDLKYHDIPNTVAGACRAAADLGVWMVNVHAQGGRRMMEAAKEAVAGGPQPPQLVAVTLLTSLGQDDLLDVGLSSTPLENVVRLARLARDSGLDGVVCSPHEIKALRQTLPKSFTLVTPGIRPAGGETQDQKRVMTAAEAVERGTDYLVIGRPITRAEDPMAALAAIEDEIKGEGA